MFSIPIFQSKLALIRKHILFVIVLLVACQCTYAHHIKGGWIGYKYVSSTSSTITYSVTVNLYVSCTVTGPTESVILGVFDGTTKSRILTQTIQNTTNKSLTKSTYSACISNPPTICYKIYTYSTTITVPINTGGYTLTVQDALREDNIINISNSGSTGITITGTIPGTIDNVSYATNNSPDFVFQDTAIVCHNSAMSIPFTATDTDGDSLSYSFTNGLNVSNPSQNTASTAPAAPPYPSLTYLTGYSGSAPMGSAVTIDPATGLISGTAPNTTGDYVVAVYIKEWRNGILLDSIKKELIITVNDCSLSGASLNPTYINCDDYNLTFSNLSTSNINTYLWNFGDSNSSTNISTDANPTHQYSAAGTYTLKLKVSNSSGCEDSTTSQVKVYPGFSAGFYTKGTCYQTAIQFIDTSYCKYGSINNWAWTFGDGSSANLTTSGDTSHQYSTPATYTSSLIITSTYGCTDTATRTVIVNDKPSLSLPFSDTLICSIDSLQLHVISTDATDFVWTSSDKNILNSNTAAPIVYPKDTASYMVTVSNGGCVDSATVTVNVLDYVTVQLQDTTACIGDSLTLHPTSQALSFQWTQTSGADSLNNYYIKNPSLLSSGNDAYHLIANLGKCSSSADITILASNYPTVQIEKDTSICYGSTVVLYGTTDASNYIWSNGNNSSLQISVGPTTTTSYYLYASNPNSYCTKTIADTATITVQSPFTVSAGRDTSIVYDQPLLLHATASISDSNLNYTWSPADYLSNTDSAYTTATIPLGILTQYYTVTATSEMGCSASDQIKISIYQTGPDIIVPSGFTPNQDGKNDVSRPILIGIAKFDGFQIYNRWGELIFSTQTPNVGWDGNYHGQQQQSGSTFIYHTSGTDYTGKKIDKKGTIVLIR